MKKSFRANGKLEMPMHNTHALAVRNITDEDIKTFGRVPGSDSYVYTVRFLLDEVASSILCIVKGNRRCSWDLPQHRWASIYILGKENILAIYAQTQPTELNFHFRVSFSALLHVHYDENWRKKLANCCDSPNSPKFFPL